MKNQDYAKGAEYFENEPMRCRLFEIMFGELSNLRIQMYDYKLAEKHRPNYVAFSEDNVMRCLHFDELPSDWQRYALACIEQYFE